MLQDYQNKATDYKGQYSKYQGEADVAGKSVNDYTTYMQGEGSATNTYNKSFDQKKTELGYDPEQMTGARANLTQATGALSAYSDFANTAASKWGMNAGGFAAANAGALGSLNNNIASNQTVVNSLSDLYKTAQTGANEFTGTVIAGQRETMAGLQQVFTNAANQRDSAASMMNFYDKLAQEQGGLNAQQQQYYAAAAQAYAAANQAEAQARQIQQQIDQTKSYMNSPAYQAYLKGSPAATSAPAAPKANAAAPSGGGIAKSFDNPFSMAGLGAAATSLIAPGAGIMGAVAAPLLSKATGVTPSGVFNKAKSVFGNIF